MTRISLDELRRRYALPNSRFGTFGGIPVSYTHLTLPTNREV